MFNNFVAVQKSLFDYYPFGMAMPGREFSSTDYRYGFNGKENDNEVKGNGNSLDFGARIYDPRLGRWMSPDPKAHEYMSWSPYNFAMNTPISAYDADGKRTYFVGGAGLDNKGWNYTDRWAASFKNNGLKGFTPLRDVSHDKAGSFPAGDIAFTLSQFSSTSTPTNTVSTYNPSDPLGSARGVHTKQVVVTDAMVTKAVNEIIADLTKNPLAEGEQLNLTGYSYGSVLQAHVALGLTAKGYKVDNLVLVGSPISSNSELFKKLQSVTNVIREDIKGDKLSDESGGTNMFTGAIQNLDPNGTGEGAHFDLARPGAAADKHIDNTVKDIKAKGVE